MDSIKFLNDELAKTNKESKIFIFGSYAGYLYGFEDNPNDIDCFVEYGEVSLEVLDRINKLLETPFDNEIQNNNIEPFEPKYFNLFKTYSNLKVYIATKEYLLVQLFKAATVNPNKRFKYYNSIDKLMKLMGIDIKEAGDTMEKLGYDVGPVISYEMDTYDLKS